MLLQYVWSLNSKKYVVTICLVLNSKKYVVTICLVSQGNRHRDPETLFVKV